MEMKGVCFLHSETGTEGGYWAMQEDGFETSDGFWSYEGLRLLEEGDEFAVFDDDGSVLWSGVIHKDKEIGLRNHSIFRDGNWIEDSNWKQQEISGFWVHWLQKDTDPDFWFELFNGNRRCLLKR